MADQEDVSQNTEQPTQKRLDLARDAGDIVKSAEVNTLILLGGGAIAIAVFGPSMALGIGAALRAFLEQPDAMAVDGASLLVIIRVLLLNLGAAVAPFFAVLAVAALAGHLMQGRVVLNIARLSPDFSRLSLAAGLKRMFGAQGWMNLLKGLLKIAVVGLAIWTQIWPARADLETILTQSCAAVVGDMMHLLFRVLMAALVVLSVIAIADYLFQRLQWLKRNRMSKQDIKEENRQNEGDPLIKARIRQLRLARSKKRMMAQVPKAAVVIMNPSHYAVALKYESGKMAAPVCVAKGVDALALKIRAVAQAHDVPVIENPPLARALHAAVDIDEQVPPQHFKAVAQVIGYVMRLRGQRPTALL